MKVDKKKLSIPVTFEVQEDVENADGRFTKVKCWLMHTNKNLNNSVFTQEVIEEALPTLQYIPLVGFIEKDIQGEDDFSDHRYIILKDLDGVRRKYLGSAYGVILSNADNNAHFEERICEDGEARNFLVAEGIMWNMFESSSDIMTRDLIKDHSIELDENSVEGYEEDGVFYFTKFSFRAACILGGGSVPAMTGSTVEVMFSVTDFIKSIQDELNDKYSQFTAFTKAESKQSKRGGAEGMGKVNFSQTALELFSDISNIVKQYEQIQDRWGDSISRYYLVDLQDNEAICVDREDSYRYYGFAFTVDGDKPVVDFTTRNRKKLRYEPYEEGAFEPEGAFDFGKHISEIEEAAFTKVSEANEKVDAAEQAKSKAESDYSQIKTEYEKMKPKYDEYVRVEAQRRSEELNAQKEAKFAEYEDVLADNAEFTALKERKEELSVEDIEKECAVLYVRTNRLRTNFSKTGTGSAVVGVMDDGDDEKGFVDTKYGKIPVHR